MITNNMHACEGVSKYVHLYRCIRADIENGSIAPREKLPSKRELAAHLGVSVVTVEAAYSQLVAEGYVDARPRSGYFACDVRRQGVGAFGDAVRKAEASARAGGNVGRGLSASRNVSVAHAGTASPVASECTLSQVDDRACSQQEIQTLLADFTGATAAGAFPYKQWARCVREVLSAVDERDLGQASASAAGSYALRSAIANYLHGFRGMNVSPNQVVVGAGAQTLYALIVQLLGRDRCYAIEDPGYPRLARIYASNDVALEYIPVDAGGACVSALCAGNASVLHCMPSHQLPTGVVMPAARRYELLEWACAGGAGVGGVSADGAEIANTEAGGAETDIAKAGGTQATARETSARATRYIVEDDYDCEFRMAGSPVPSLMSIDAHERVIYANTFTKTLGAAFRIGYAVLPEHLARRFHNELGFYACTVGAIDQLALARFIETGEYERHVNRMRVRYRRVQDALVRGLLSSRAARHICLHNVGAGLHFVMEIEGVCTEAMCECALDGGVRLAPISAYATSSRVVSASACASIASEPASAPSSCGASVSAAATFPPGVTSSAQFVMNFAGIAESAVEQIVEVIATAIEKSQS